MVSRESTKVSHHSFVAPQPSCLLDSFARSKPARIAGCFPEMNSPKEDDDNNNDNDSHTRPSMSSRAEVEDGIT